MKRTAVIFDVDGTLADVRGIRHYVVGTRRKNFEAFHAESVNVPAHSHVVNAAQVAHMLGHDVVVVTARKVKWARHTGMWLALNNVPSAAMFMRRDDDSRADVEVKRDILGAIKKSWDVVAAWDDNPKIVELWESEGIHCNVVEGWMTDEA